MFRTMLLVHLLNRLQSDLKQLTRIHLFVGLTAVVAVTAFLLGIFLSEIVQQQFTPTNRTLCITLCLKQQLVAYADLLRSLVFLKTSQTLDVVRAVETQADTFSAVTTCTTGLLIIALQTLRYVVMYDKTNIRLVNTHSEGDCRYDHLTLLHQERILVRTSRLCVHSRVVGSCTNSVYLQHFRQILHFLACQAVNNTALTLHAANETNQILVHLRRLRTYLIIQVRTVKTALENSRLHHA